MLLVYSMYSRGQLGHGSVSVDVVTEPTLISTFQGFTVVAIATGGWHSAALTGTGFDAFLLLIKNYVCFK